MSELSNIDFWVVLICTHESMSFLFVFLEWAGLEPWPWKWRPLQGVQPLSSYTRAQDLWSARKTEKTEESLASTLERKVASSSPDADEDFPAIFIFDSENNCPFCPDWVICESVICTEINFRNLGLEPILIKNGGLALHLKVKQTYYAPNEQKQFV